MSEEPAAPPQASAPEPARDFEAIVRAVRAALIPGSPIAQDAACLGHLDHVFIPALIVALKKG